MFQAVHLQRLSFPNRKRQRPTSCHSAARHDLILVGVLLLGAESASNVSAVVRGIEMRLMPSENCTLGTRFFIFFFQPHRHTRFDN